MPLISPPNYPPRAATKRWRLVSEPTVEPVTFTDYIDYQRVRNADIKESVVLDKLTSARERVESWVKHTCVNQTWDLFLDVPPVGGGLTVLPWTQFYGVLQATAIEFPKSPFISLIGCYITDDTGTESTVDPATYWVSKANDPARLALRSSFDWPDTNARGFESFRARFVCGYLTPFTCTGSSSDIAAPTHGKAVGDIVRLTNRDGVLPAPLQERADYYVVAVPDGNTLRLATSSSGSAIVCNDSGTGTQFIGVLPSRIRRAILLTTAEDRYGADEKRKGVAKSAQLKKTQSGLPEEAENILELIRSRRIA